MAGASEAVRASWEITVPSSEGVAPMWTASQVIPRKRVPRITDMTIRVRPAFRLRGSLKAVMPFEIASTPVRAVVPLEKAWRSRKSVTAAASEWKGGGGRDGPEPPGRKGAEAH